MKPLQNGAVISLYNMAYTDVSIHDKIQSKQNIHHHNDMHKIAKTQIFGTVIPTFFSICFYS